MRIILDRGLQLPAKPLPDYRRMEIAWVRYSQAYDTADHLSQRREFEFFYDLKNEDRVLVTKATIYFEPWAVRAHAIRVFPTIKRKPLDSGIAALWPHHLSE